MPLDTSILKQAGGWAIVLAVCVVAGSAAGRRVHQRQLLEAADRAQDLAAAFAPTELVGVGRGEEDALGPANGVKERLVRLQQSDPAFRRLCLLRLRGLGRSGTIADSTAASRGEADGAGIQRSEAFATAVRTGLAAAQPPDPSQADPVILGVAPVTEARAGSTAYYLALEEFAAGWRTEYWSGFAQWFFYAGMLVGIPYALVLARQRDQQQRTALRKISEAMEQSRSAVMIVNEAGRIEYANAGLCQQIGFTRRELIGRHWREFQQPETTPDLLAEMVATVRAGRHWHGEWFNRRKTGELYAVRGDISPVRGRDQKIISFVAVFEDMTDAKRAEATLRAALDRAEAGDRAKSQFLATMSHEVRTPLNGIVGFTSLLSEMPLGPEASEYIQTIRTSAEALIQLTGDILDFAKIETGGIKLELQPTNPRSIVEDTLDLFAMPAAVKKLELLHWAEEDVPASVLADESRLRQILANLVGNAVKFTAAGTVSITLRRAPGTPGRLEFSVHDTGIGIAANQQARLFKPFRQVDDTTTRRFGGTGLGLAISRNLAQLMGGDIGLESELGRGSRFVFHVPAEPVPAVARVSPRLTGIRLALAARPGAFRDEFLRLAERWGARCEIADEVGQFRDAGAGDFLCLELEEAQARQLARQPAGALAWPPPRAFAMVPVGLDNELRTALVAHFRQLVNKPLRHDAFAGLVAGAAAPPAPPKAPPRQFGFNVLVVEDNLVNQRLVQRLLSALGCGSTVANNGMEGLAALRGADLPFDLVLMDLHMPELDGVGAIQQVRGGRAGQAVTGIWITVLTADARSEQKEKVYQAGANDYLVKPVSLGDLAISLQRFAEGRRPPPTSAPAA